MLDVTREVILRDETGLRILLDSKCQLPESLQILPPAGQYAVTIESEDSREVATLTIDENSVRLPLAADTRIRYIVLQEKRVE